ncbi:MAG: response regulator [Vicinamibacterales bacterium]
MPTPVPPHRAQLVLVDDDLETREMYTAWLEHVGFHVLHADNADTGFRYAVDRQPQVVITDHVLKIGSSGSELCRRLKGDPRTTHIPTLLMTGAAERRTSESAIEAGCAVVRLKPYLPDAMLADIDAIIRGDRIERFPSEHGPQRD